MMSRFNRVLGAGCASLFLTSLVLICTLGAGTAQARLSSWGAYDWNVLAGDALTSSSTTWNGYTVSNVWLFHNLYADDHEAAVFYSDDPGVLPTSTTRFTVPYASISKFGLRAWGVLCVAPHNEFPRMRIWVNGTQLPDLTVDGAAGVTVQPYKEFTLPAPLLYGTPAGMSKGKLQYQYSITMQFLNPLLHVDCTSGRRKIYVDWIGVR